MLLSIGMIMKNEAANLDKTLTAIKPILDALDSELIIADTGSTDNSVEIAKKYTDNVFHFEWINDFAAARNSTINRSQGEWYMVLDADEVFQDCGPIIQFFKSGEYKHYSLATVIVRNYSDLSGTMYSDMNGIRLVKKIPNLHYRGRIHETLNLEDLSDNVKFLTAVADHYGYVYEDDPELKAKKIKRNLELLLEVEKDEENIKYHALVYKQIADCYSYSDQNKALEYIEKGIERVKDVQGIGFSMVDYYISKAQTLFNMERYEEVIAACDVFLDPKLDLRIKYKVNVMNSDIEAYLLKALALSRLARLSEAIDNFGEFFKLYRDDMNGKLETADKLLSARTFSSGSNLPAVLTQFTLVCTAANRFSTLDTYLKILPVSEYKTEQTMNFRINTQFEIMNHLGYKDMQKFYNQLNDHGKKAFAKYARHGLFFTSNQSERIAAVLKLKTDDEALLEAFRVYEKNLTGGSDDPSSIYEFGSRYGYLGYPEMLYLLLYINADITPVFSDARTDDEYIGYVCETYPGFIDILSFYDTDKVSFEGLEKAAVICKKTALKAAAEGKDYDAALKKLAAVGKRWVGLTENAEDMPDDIRAAVIVGNIISDFERKDHKHCTDELKELFEASSEYSPIVLDYQRRIRAEKNTADNSAVKDEMAELAVKVKENIRAMISAGNLTVAESKLRELAELRPGDPEIAMIFEEIEKAKG